MYCSIKDAWSNNNFRTEHFNQYQQLPQKLIPVPEIPVNKCNSIIEHIESCPKCKKYILDKYSNNNYMEIFNTNPEIRETILVFLIGILILLTLNLFIK